MRILFLCHKIPYPPNDGGAIATLNMIHGFAAASDQLTVLTMQTYKHNFSIEDLPFEIKSQADWHQVWVDTKIKPVKAFFNLLFSKKPYNAQRFHSSLFQQQLIQILTNHSFDIIQLEGLYVSSYIPIIKKYSQSLISFRAHNVESEIWERLAIQEPTLLKKRYYNLLAQRIKKIEIELMDGIDLLVPITSKDALFFPFKDKGACKVCPTGMVTSKFKLTQPEKLKTLFFIGALDWLPNQEGLLWFIENIWIKIHDKYPDWKFIIAGRQAPKAIEQKLKKYPVVYLGEVNDSTVFIDTYQLMVVPLLSGSGMRIKIVEAMARGKCIVTTSKGAEGIDALNHHDIIIADAPNEIIAILEKLFENPNLIKDYGENAFKFASDNFKNEPIINELREFYLNKLLTIDDLS